MARTRIQAAERPVGEIFSDAYRFSVPRYQRPYAWTVEQAGEMLDDLLTAARCAHNLEDSDPYFLGSVVLVKEEGVADAEVVDGQQRLTTLIMLLSVVRQFLPASFAASLNRRIFQEGDPIKGTMDQPRLTLKDRDQSFFEKQILDGEGVSALEKVATAGLTDSQRNLVLNARLFRDRFAQLSADECRRLVSFVDGYTYLVVVATQDFDSAYRIFTVLNERGLNLTHSDILKSEIIGQVPSDAQDAYTATWEGEEEALGRREFAELFAHIRMVYAKTKARETILKEFRAAVLSRVPDPRVFVSNVLVPYSDAFKAVSRASYQAEEDAEAVNDLLRSLNLLDNTDWIPPAISFFSRHGGDQATTLAFIRNLDRLASSMHIRRVDVTQRVERYGRVLRAVERGEDLTHPDSPLQLDDDERSQTLNLLDGEIYTVVRLRLYVLLRLDSTLSSGGANYEHPFITVEHVLPQNPKADSDWRALFTDEERAYWVHRLANLLLLTRRKNSEASNRSFDEKKSGYFTGRSGASPFPLTSQVLHQPKWTPEVLQQRQGELLSHLKDLWRL
ncbi:DUF262 domain-containing protein [Micromonospora profundi]|uniref:DUF262 domain-containing protein n=1 Tax=Micromonospora profundi TaxID=1420889 RepID=A0AAJ6HUN4_9ACTN|nr:DUF262 domain-containing protein [Micromonospora profundi]WLS44509.1 DUF262 domain-containing protein [Micromonospora profundi]